MPEERGSAVLGGAQPGRVVRVTADSRINPGTIVKAVTGQPITVAPATTNEPVYGVCTSGAGAAGDFCSVMVSGQTWLIAAPNADWVAAGHNRVVAGSGGLRVYEGNPGNPWFATLLLHDTVRNLAYVSLHTDAETTVGRGMVDVNGRLLPNLTLDDNTTVSIRAGNVVGLPSSGGSLPSFPFTGQTFYDTGARELLVWDGTRWTSTSHSCVLFGRNGTNITSVTLGCHSNLTANDNGLPWTAPGDVRILYANFSLRSDSVGGSNWTSRIRLNGTGTNSWNSTARLSTTSWQSFPEDVNLDLVAGDRVRILVNTSDAAEDARFTCDLYYVNRY